MDRLHSQQTSQGFFGSGLRRVVGGLVMAGILVLALFAAALLTVAAFAVMAVFAAIGAAVYVYAWLKRERRDGDDSPGVLNARKGASGWTVDTAGRFSL